MIALDLVERAMAKAQGAQASVAQGESAEVSFESDRLKAVKSSQSTGMAVKVILDGKIGSSHTTDVQDVEGVVQRALEAAEFGSPTHFRFPEAQEGPEVKVYDDAVLPVTKAEMVSIGEEMMGLLKAYNADIILDAGARKAVGRREFANSSGVAFVTDSTSFGVSIHGQWIRGTDILSAGHSFGWRKRDVDHVEVARKAVELFRMAESVAPMRSGQLPVIFTPEGMGVLLLALRLGLNGKNVFLGSSPLAGKLGDRIADERLSIIDNPLLDYASRSARYDDEGVPHRITPLIREGVVTSYLYDLDTAGRAGTQSTGHGVGCGPTNLLVGEGDTPLQEMIESVEEGLLVHSVLGLGQGNPISGEFSVNVHLGYKIDHGEVVGRVKDVMLAGNTYDALKDIVAIGDTAEWVGGSLITPPVQVGQLSVVAR